MSEGLRNPQPTEQPVGAKAECNLAASPTAGAAAASAAAAAATPFSRMPMFYRELVALTPEQHLGWGVRPVRNLSAAAHANAVPVGVGEFFLISQHYPLVFAPVAQGHMPLAVTAFVQGGRNLFVQPDGQWRPDTYVPGYLRRYPFWIEFHPTGQNAYVWFDPNAQRLVPLQDAPDAVPLFDHQGQANQALRQAVEFGKVCKADETATRQFILALQEQKLLREQHIRVELAPGKPYVLSGFCTVDEDAYRALPDALLADWARRGWAGLIALHLYSVQHNWQLLLTLHRQQQGEA